MKPEPPPEPALRAADLGQADWSPSDRRPPASMGQDEASRRERRLRAFFDRPTSATVAFEALDPALVAAEWISEPARAGPCCSIAVGDPSASLLRLHLSLGGAIDLHAALGEAIAQACE